MSISKTQVADIKTIIRSFIDNNAFIEGEDHIVSYYIIDILKIIGWDKTKCRFKPHKDTTGKFPDLSLKNKSERGFVFIIEAKESNKSLDDSYGKLPFAQQLCNYCNAHGIYWGILTNFLEWRIYNTVQYEKEKDYYEEKIVLIDKEKKQMVCTDEQLHYLFGLIEYENLNSIKGRISKDKRYYRKQIEIREEFFDKLKNWRARLRNFLHHKYPQEEPGIIDNQTQKILDRFIFIAYSYKKEIISQDYLSAVLFSERIDFYDELKRNFIDLNDKFNSDIFSYDKCDEWKIDDEVLEYIIPEINSIDFSQLNPNIIGEVYEDYLGELLRESKKGIQVVSSKELVKRKKQGIYYTPEYIVKYIVDNTLGERLKKCKTEKEIEKIKVIDIACGSGSFLLYAFDVFKSAYENAGRKKQPDIFSEIALRKRILLNNLYGVDLDERAVDIAKLNLLLKALEGLQETEKNGRKILPNLSLNIRCGNSLIYGCYKDEEVETNGQLNFLFGKKSDFKNDIKELTRLKEKFYQEEDNEEKERIINLVELHEAKINKYLNKDLENYFDDTGKIKPFNFDVAFCEVLNPKQNGGFDCVIGNPPYKMFSRVTGSSSKSYSDEEKEYFNAKYKNSAEYKLSTYAIFSDKAMTLLKENGRFGYILPDSFIMGYYFSKFRRFLLDKFHINQIALINKDFWKEASVGFPSILISSKDKNKKMHAIKAEIVNDEKISITDNFIISQNYFNKIPRNKFRLFFSRTDKQLIEKIEKKRHSLENIIKIQVGIRARIEQEKIISEKQKSALWVKGLIDGNEVYRYRINYKKNFIWLNKEFLWAGGHEKEKIENEKLLIRKTGDTIIATYDNKGFYHLDNLHFGCLLNSEYSLKFILGIINSRLFVYYYRTITLEKGRVMAQTDIETLHSLKIPIINFQKAKDRQTHDKLAGMVSEMLELSKQPEENKNKIKVADLEIDGLVYKLFGINYREQTFIDKAIK